MLGLVIGGIVLVGLTVLWMYQTHWDGKQVQQRQREYAERRRTGEVDGPESRTNPDLTPPHGGGGIG